MVSTSDTIKPAVKIGKEFQNPIPVKVGGFSLLPKVIPQYLFNREERVPRKQLEPFRTDPGIFKTIPATGLRITWLGHSSMLMEIDGVRLLIDPMWDPRASPFTGFGPKRFFDPPIAISDLPPIDIVLISHDHYDHLGKQTIQRLSGFGAKWVTSLGVGAQLREFGVVQEIRELNWTESFKLADAITITALPACHFSGRGMLNRFHTLWSSFVIESARHKVYFGADSGYWKGFAEIGEKHGPFDLTMLEIGAYNDLWKSIHMGPEGAQKAFLEMGGAGLLMPIHWGLFDLALHAWYQPIERMNSLADASGIKLWSPEPGRPSEVTKNQALRSEWWKRFR